MTMQIHLQIKIINWA